MAFALCQACSAATQQVFVSFSQHPHEVGTTLQLQKLGLKRLRHLPKNT